MARKAEKTQEIDITEIGTNEVMFYFVGITPLIMNAMPEKARQELLLPRRKLNNAERAGTLKHNPTEEFVNSTYRWREDKETRLYIPSPAFKGAIRNAALRLPGSTKTEIGQLVWVNSFGVNVYGVPQLRMDMVRQAGINKTPDVRTRACLGE